MHIVQLSKFGRASNFIPCQKLSCKIKAQFINFIWNVRLCKILYMLVHEHNMSYETVGKQCQRQANLTFAVLSTDAILWCQLFNFTFGIVSLCILFTLHSNITQSNKVSKYLTLLLLKKITLHSHFKFSTNQVAWSNLLLLFIIRGTNSVDPDQLASSEAGWLGSTLFARYSIFVLSRTRVWVLMQFVPGIYSFLF